MVVFRLKILFVLLLLTQLVDAQNVFLDDIHLMNQQRENQLLDTNFNNKQSFLIRSTSIYNDNFKTKYKKKFIQNLVAGYDFVNNSLLPQNWNDGNMYPARGWQERYSVGLNVKLWVLDINFQPEWLKVQNIPQEPYNGNNEDGNFMPKYFGSVANVIDNFRQFGTKKIDTFSWGQSRIGLKIGPIGLGYSNENIWWGPGKRNSLVFTNNAAGFKHYYLQTNKPIKTPVGHFELAVISGIIDTSWFTDPDLDLMRRIWSGGIAEKNLDQRGIDGITLNYNPSFMPNLYLGYAYSRQYYKNEIDPKGNSYPFVSKDKYKQEIGSFIFRFVLPKDHAEFYGEVGTPNKDPWPRAFFQNSPKTGFVIGASKIVNFPNLKSYLHLNVEMTQLQLYNPKDMFYPGWAFVGGLPNSWYTNSTIKQGYTNQGQIMGAAIGPGSNSQTIDLSYHYKLNYIGIMVERISQNNDFFSVVYFSGRNGQVDPTLGQLWGYYNKYWADINIKIYAQAMPIKNILLAASFMNTNAINYRWLKYIEPGSKYDDPSSVTDKFNVQFQFSVKYILHGTNK